MGVQLLIATMNQSDFELIKKNNVNSDAIVGNQTNYNRVERFEHNGHKIQYISTDDRGVSRNRNIALMKADQEICVIADDDIVYTDDYVKTIEDAYEQYPNADVILFNLYETSNARYIVKKPYKVNYFGFMRFHSPRITFRREKIITNGIFFNVAFGAGAKGGGDDTLFLKDCLDKKLTIIALPYYIGEIAYNRPSTWFTGYDKDYFLSLGEVIKVMSRRWAWSILIILCIKHYKSFSQHMSIFEAYKLMKLGAKKV